MEDFTIYMPTRIVFGEGRLKDAGELVAPYAERAVVVTGRSSMKNAGFLDELVESLEASGVAVPLLIEGTPPNPTVDFVDESVGRLKEYVPGEVDIVIGLGGGSALDSAKALAFSCANEGSVWEYISPSGEKKQPARIPLPTMMIPSTSGTGSETSCAAVISNTAEGAKVPLAGPYLFPRMAVIDPRLPATMPPRLTAATGIDTWSHVFENYTQSTSDPFTDLVNVETMRLVGEWLPAAVAQPSDMEARSRMAVASFYGGFSLGISGAHVGHALEHPISAITDCPHGEGLAFVLKGVTSWLEQVSPERAALVAALLPGEGALGTRYRQFLQSVGMDRTPSDLGFAENDFDRIATLALDTMGGACNRAPVPVGKQDLVAILAKCLE
ncbi:MAG: iron-containing alcohol dehydrogenase [Planctomycetes bacterium]|nr:iron-containing alcohol dehydrogenase [Planctomycetota bacterium]